MVNATKGQRDHMTLDHGLTREDCSFEGPRGTWHVSRVGPVKQNNKSWHAVWWDVFPHLKQEPGIPTKTYVTSSLLSVTDASGSIVPYPPVHMHHAHMYYTDSRAPLHPHTPFLSETHGDASCDSTNRGPSCYMFNIPDTFGFIAPESFFADSVVNFVADGDMEFWFDYSVQILHDEKGQEAIVLFPLGIDEFNPVQYREAHTFQVPKTGESVNWNTMRVPMDSELMWWKWHVHAYFVEDVWVINAREEDIGLNKGVFKLKDTPLPPEEQVPTSAGYSPIPCLLLKGQVFDADEHGLSLAQVKSHIMDNLERFRSKGNPDAAIVHAMGDVWDSHEVIGGVPAARRQLTVPLAGFKLKASQEYTTVSFFKARPEFGVLPEDAEPVRMHVKLAMYLRPDFSAFQEEEEEEEEVVTAKDAGAAEGTSAPASSASGVGGAWQLSVPKPDGSLDDPMLKFVKGAGDKMEAYLEGSVYTGKVSKLKVTGSKFSFSFKAPTPLGFKVSIPMEGSCSAEEVNGVVKTPFGESKFTGKKLPEGTLVDGH